jgi:Zn-dependent protease with chaperone function
MINAARAGLSAVLLLGFYVYAFGIVAALGVLTIVLVDRVPGAVVSKLGYLTLAVAGAVLYATWKVLRAKPKPMPGLVLSERHAPLLWAEVRAIAAEVRTRVPDEVRLVADVNAAVSEDTRLLGLRGGRRYLYVGLPLLQAMNLAQFRSVLAHELGHYSHQHTRLGALTYRGMNTMVQTIVRVGPTSLAGLLLRIYARVYHLVSAAVSRTQEIEADRASVRVAGRQAAASALRELPALDAAWAFYLNNYVGWGLDSGHAPSDVLAQFPTLLAARAGELAEILITHATEVASRYDSHPPIGVRIALMEREPEARVAVDTRPAGVLLGDLEAAAAELEAEVLDFGDRTRVPFQQYAAIAMQWHTQREADVLYRAAARLTGAVRGHLGVVLDLLDSGGAEGLRRAVLRPGQLSNPRSAQDAFHGYVGAALAAALVGAGAASWRHSWSEPVTLVDAAGEPLDIDALAALAAGGKVADVRARLSALGVDAGAAAAGETSATAVGAEALAGIMNAKIDGKRQDLVILDTGLIIVPGVVRLKQRQVRPRMHHMLTAVPPRELAGMPGHRFVAYEEIATAALTRRVPVTYEFVLHSGEQLKIRWSSESEEMGSGWEALARAAAMVTPAR